MALATEALTPHNKHPLFTNLPVQLIFSILRGLISPVCFITFLCITGFVSQLAVAIDSCFRQGHGTDAKSAINKLFIMDILT